ncbi:ATP-binding cassette domain-containing protein [Methanothermobacter marburgensis]|uniref:Predicted ABC transporter, ATPase component n=1 Tax=Methanothermobacter marburgensis (strain ATCC BAA-927 / DSM 2133 / JCM 14651 / NBRC 100331 / OCM 82 / Marburg) TaxID=79929 RepID=D9PXV7_METTM|nr:ATP-binding cassette domain-containing protein [Methanothermobacter marburgensis]ADL59055.1 predicted ABC transporter, ATPase component [Methanothermobacter marburgensis str. Marburg]WBF09581.1 ATP-binding cassette domain-containing protein [Methanothermobacter marburgensis]
MGNIIETEGISKRYDDFLAVNSVDLEVPENSIYGVLGPNGAGKTTLISMLCTILHPTSGRGMVNGYDIVREARKVRESIGIVFQSRALDDILTGREHLEMHAALYGVPRDIRKRRIDEVLELIALGDKADEYVKTYSGGMKRRLEIGRGLIHHPRVLFLDEPTLGLDPQTRESIWRYIERLNREEDVTVLLTTHYMEEADKLCDEVAIMSRGEIIKADSPSNLKRELGADTITVRVDRADEFHELLVKQDYVKKAYLVDDEVKVLVERGENLVPEIVNLAARTGFYVRSVELEHPTLEDVFIRYTGRGITEA